jgi:Zn-dependent peptidase ImmA (M78 family)
MTRQRSPREWREHHADYFAAALAMPNATFKPLVHQLLREHDVWKGKIVLGMDEDMDELAKYILPEHISEIYGVSRRAAYVKLCKTGFVVDRVTQQRKEAQVSVF